MDNANRDHLANERTFLAYLRTALAFIAFGFVVARFSLFVREFSTIAHVRIAAGGNASVILGAAIALFGVLVGAYGAGRYITMHAAIVRRHDAPLSGWTAAVAGLAVAAIGVVVAVAVLSVR